MSVLPIDYKTICAGVYVILMMFNFNMTVHADAQEDDYLKALESEAGELKDFDITADSTSNEIANSAAKTADEISPKENEFSDALKSALPNTFLIYQKLSKAQKGLVVEAYFVNDRSMAEASRQIFNIYFKRIKAD